MDFSPDLFRRNPDFGDQPFSHSPPRTRRPTRQTPKNAPMGDITALGSPALAVQPFSEGMEASLYVERLIVLRIVISSDRSMEY